MKLERYELASGYAAKLPCGCVFEVDHVEDVGVLHFCDRHAEVADELPPIEFEDGEINPAYTEFFAIT